jgi:serine protease Do
MNSSCRLAVITVCASGMFVPRAEAQEARVRVIAPERTSVVSFARLAGDRAVIGVGLSTGSVADTLGLEVLDVTADGPAAKAGIAVGSRLQAINGVSLRVSADDARDPLTADAGYRRLQRVLGDVKAGESVSLLVWTDGAARSVKVSTVAQSALTVSRSMGSVTRIRENGENRSALGLRLGSAGNARDTLGLFITSVHTDGPAEKAGIIEGQRIAAINGVDVRVPREDVADGLAASARLSRFMRELQKAAPGDRVTLRVYADGRYRELAVTAGKASEFGDVGFFLRSGEDVLDVQRALEEQVRGRTFPFDGAPTPPVRLRSAPASPSIPAPPLPPARVRLQGRRAG